MKIALATAAALVVVPVTLAVLPGNAAPTRQPAAAATELRLAYTPPHEGITLNDPNGQTASVHANLELLLGNVDHTPQGAHIDLATWNFASDRAVDALVSAHQRGVRVRVITALKARDQDPVTGPFYRLKEGLKGPRNDPAFDAVGKSWVRACQKSCRGKKGAMHAKFSLFSQVDSIPNVVLVSSANITEDAGALQWNDTYTLVNRSDIYAAWLKHFGQMAKDQAVKSPYKQIRHNKKYSSFFLPYTGPASRDPVLRRLQGVRCLGAAKGAGNGQGRTRIRIASTAWMDERGIMLAKRFKALYDQGCDIKVVYAVMPPKIREALSTPGPRGAVPRKPLTRDSDGDGYYDVYLHSNVMTIDGVRGAKRNAHVVWNGSAIWDDPSLIFDEAGLQITGKKKVVHQYADWVDYLFNHAPANPGDPPPPTP